MVIRVKPWISIVDPKDESEAVAKMKMIELLARTSRLSEDRIDSESYTDFIRRRLNMDPPHLSILRHSKASARCLTSRHITHELVRHHVGIHFTQESTRYVDYLDRGISVIYPLELDTYPGAKEDWDTAMEAAEEAYCNLRTRGVPPEIARGVLPHDLAASISITANLEAWRSLFIKRTHRTAHLHIQELMWDALKQLDILLPPVFEGLW